MEKTKELTWNDICVGQYIIVTGIPDDLRPVFSHGLLIRKTSEFDIGIGIIQSAIAYGNLLGNCRTICKKYVERLNYRLVSEEELIERNIF